MLYILVVRLDHNLLVNIFIVSLSSSSNHFIKLEKSFVKT